ncbi:DUF4410 domain-containing protein [bacterium]|nr:DUF4410 domain-containing protein [bacterium]
MKTRMLFALLVLLCVGMIASAENNRKQYQAIVIQQFDVRDGIQFPDDYRTSLQNDLHDQLQKLNTFSVRMMESSDAALDQKTMRITGQIIEYHPGSKTARALFGMLAGSTTVKAHIQVFDATDGSLLFEDDVDGKVTYWSPDQDSKGATEGLAKEVAKKIKKRFA